MNELNNEVLEHAIRYPYDLSVGNLTSLLAELKERRSQQNELAEAADIVQELLNVATMPAHTSETEWKETVKRALKFLAKQTKQVSP